MPTLAQQNPCSPSSSWTSHQGRCVRVAVVAVGGHRSPSARSQDSRRQRRRADMGRHRLVVVVDKAGGARLWSRHGKEQADPPAATKTKPANSPGKSH